jgi:hypothetical protein
MNAILDDSFMLICHIDLLLGNDRETNNETRDVVRQRPACIYGSTFGSSSFCGTKRLAEFSSVQFS